MKTGKMKRSIALTVFSLALGLLMLPGVALATGVSVTSPSSPPWLLLPNSIGQGVPELGGCQRTCRRLDVALKMSLFASLKEFFSSMILSPQCPGYYTINSSDNRVSDVITFANTGPGGNGEINFFSDPNLPIEPRQ